MVDAGAGGGVLHHHALLRVLLQLAAVPRHHQLVVALHAAARVQLLRPRQLVAGLLGARPQLVAGAGVGEGGGGGGVVLQGAGAGQRAGVEAGQLGLGVAVSQQRHGVARLQGPQRRVCEGRHGINNNRAFSVTLNLYLFVLTLRWMTEYWSVGRDCCPKMSSN